MHKLITQIGLLATTCSIALLSTSCGATKVIQCNSVAKVTKEAEVVANEFATAAKTTSPQKVNQLLTDTSGKMRKYSKEVQDLAIQDEKIKGFQSRIAASYIDYGKSLDGMSSAITAQNKAGVDQSVADLQALATKEKNLITEFTDYCK
jgi:hypothetical protein